jgi:uncharacterized repeat protein (TIGR01451 family)
MAMTTKQQIAWGWVAGLCAMAVTALGSADMGITETDSPDPVRVGNNLTYSISVTNRGPTTATNVIVTSVLPVAMDFVSCTPSVGTYSNDNGTLYCNLGNLANAATAGVRIVVSPAATGVMTNDSSVSVLNGTGGRVSAVTTVNPANRSPEIVLPGPHVLPVGSATNFLVYVQDADHDPAVTITNTVKPSGATYINSNFAWTAGAAFAGTTNTIAFVADDHQGEANSVVTNQTTIVVPMDSDGDGLGDGWEWNNFTNLAQTATDDSDHDGQDNQTEYVAGTKPADSNSMFVVQSVATASGSSNHQVRVTTEPGRRYTIYYVDRITNAAPWQTFGNTNWGIWAETSPVSTNHIFSDNESTNTTGATPAAGMRYYKVKVAVP